MTISKMKRKKKKAYLQPKRLRPSWALICIVPWWCEHHHGPVQKSQIVIIISKKKNAPRTRDTSASRVLRSLFPVLVSVCCRPRRVGGDDVATVWQLCVTECRRIVLGPIVLIGCSLSVIGNKQVEIIYLKKKTYLYISHRW